MKFYAQNGEDKWLAEHWDRLKLPPCGVFVEVGVGDGVNISNTLWLEEKGWTGLLLEPDPRNHANILKHRKATLVKAAIGDHQRDFCVSDRGSEASGFLWPDSAGRKIAVPVRRLTDVLEEHAITSVDVLSIDTEGSELEVWSTLDLQKFRPTVVFAEWSTHGLQTPAEAQANIATITRQLRQDGYSIVHQLGCNLVFEA